MNKEDTNQLPYNLDIDLFESILNDLKSVGLEGIKMGTLWVNVKAAKNLNRSYTLNMAKYLNLIDTDKTNVWLTDMGIQSFKYASGDKRRIILAQSMPDRYKTMFKWIKNAGELATSEIKGEYVKNLGAPISTLIFDKAIATFLIYCDYLKIITYAGKGNAAKATITEFGKTVLDTETEYHEKTTPSKTDTTSKELHKQNQTSLLPDGVYPIRIIAIDRDFPWDIKSETDWIVIDSVIKSIRQDWEKNIKNLKEDNSKAE